MRGLVTAEVTLPIVTSGNVPPAPVSWAAWTAVLCAGMVTFIGVLPGAEKGTPGREFFNSLIPVPYIDHGHHPGGLLRSRLDKTASPQLRRDGDFGLNLASTLPPILNPIKRLGEGGRLAVGDCRWTRGRHRGRAANGPRLRLTPVVLRRSISCRPDPTFDLDTDDRPDCHRRSADDARPAHGASCSSGMT
jgi:hypothetical protein